MKGEALTLILSCALISCSGPAPSKGPDFVSNEQFSAHAPIPRIKQLDHRIASIPKGDSIPISLLLRQLGLWDYRQAMRSSRRSNVVTLDLSDGDAICFVAEEEPKVFTREEPANKESEWERRIKYLHIWRIIFQGVQTDLK